MSHELRSSQLEKNIKAGHAQARPGRAHCSRRSKKKTDQGVTCVFAGLVQASFRREGDRCSRGGPRRSFRGRWNCHANNALVRCTAIMWSSGTRNGRGCCCCRSSSSTSISRSSSSNRSSSSSSSRRIAPPSLHVPVVRHRPSPLLALAAYSYPRQVA